MEFGVDLAAFIPHTPTLGLMLLLYWQITSQIKEVSESIKRINLELAAAGLVDMKTRVDKISDKQADVESKVEMLWSEYQKKSAQTGLTNI